MKEIKAEQQNNPLHGKTLQCILESLVEKFGWEELGTIIRINCFNENPGIASSLKFLRKTEWARKKVEQLYIKTL
ncbi:MAG: DNA-binding protein [Ferruginibacter sp.]|nr:DNA-binding protein [Ferruginibacter sp.]